MKWCQYNKLLQQAKGEHVEEKYRPSGAMQFLVGHTLEWMYQSFPRFNDGKLLIFSRDLVHLIFYSSDSSRSLVFGFKEHHDGSVHVSVVKFEDGYRMEKDKFLAPGWDLPDLEQWLYAERDARDVDQAVHHSASG